MNKDYLDDLVARLRNSSTPAELREEVIRLLSKQTLFLEDIHLSIRQGCVRSAEYLCGAALGKPGYKVNDANF